jgi:Rps23 Pro-64 3,4-dihydroxylase Tpa1-like proline 4-hydroxylase
MKALSPKVHSRPLGKHSLFVVDGLFSSDFVRVLYEILARQSFSQSDYDTEATAHILHWKCEFPPSFFAANPLLQTWHRDVVAKASELFADREIGLKRVHANSHLFGDHQNPHTDITPGVTAVYFANAEWQSDWQGEMIFYDVAGEPQHAVAPLPGRLAVFDGSTPHRGGVPSRTCFAARLSVAFKFASSERDSSRG